MRRGLDACGRGTSRRTVVNIVGGEVLDDGRQGRDVAKGEEGRGGHELDHSMPLTK